MRLFLFCILWVALSGVASAQAPEAEWAHLLVRAEASGAVRVMVRLGGETTPEGLLSAPEAMQQRIAIAQRQETVAGLLADAKTLIRFRHIPYVALTATPEDLRRLAASPAVHSIRREKAVPVQGTTGRLDESTALIGAPEAWARGYDGRGVEVAILDTGIETSHPFFGGRVVGEACFSSTVSEDGYTSLSLCPDGEDVQIGPGAAAPCDFANECSHGTFVAGVAAGAGEEASGVAPGAGIYSIQVNSRFTEGCASECALTWESDHLQGLEHVYDLVVEEGRPIVAANLSFGGGSYTETCDSEVPAMYDAVANLLAVGVATVIASANGSARNATGYPGCLSNAVTVGATTLTDAVWVRSNVAAWMDLFAPGAGIQTSTVGGGFDVGNGTSMAAPHVTGAWAVLRQRFPNDDVAQTLARLQAAGVGILAGTPEATYPRLQINAALDAPRLAYASGSVTQVLASGATASRTVTVTNGSEAGSPDLTYTAAFENPTPWAKAVWTGAPLAPEASAEITVLLDAAGLADGTYTSRLILTSSDPTAQRVRIPVTLHVGARAEVAEITRGAGWRLLAPAAPGTTVDDLAALNLVSGVPGFYPDNGAPNLYTRYTGSGYQPLGQGEVLASGVGFWWYFYDVNFTDEGPSDSYALPMTLATPREPLATDAEVAIHAGGSRWNLLGNPFGVPLSLADVMAWPGAEETIASPTAAIYDASSNSWVLTTTETVIGPWQGFMLYGARPGTLTIPAWARVSAPAATHTHEGTFLALELTESPEAALAAGREPLADRGTVLYFDASAAPGDDVWDLPQLKPADDRYVVASFVPSQGGQLRAQEARKTLAADESTEVELAISAVGSAVTLTLTWPSLDRLPADWRASLYDTETGTTVDLREKTGYTFSVRPAPSIVQRTPLAAPELTDVTERASGEGATRFVLTVSHGAATSTSPEASGVLSLSAPVPNPARGTAQIRYSLPTSSSVRLDVVDLLGRQVMSLVEGERLAGSQTATVDVSHLAAGVYAVRLQSGDEVRVARMTVAR